MAVSPPILTIQLDQSTDCTTINLSDITTTYGLSNGVAVNDVDTVTIVVTYNSLPTTITYVFTVASGVITACTLAIASGTPANIFSELTSTVWPFTTSVPFSLFADYGVAIPEFTDDVYTVSYQIEGTNVTPEVFDFTTQESLPVTCAAQLCVNQKFADIDWACECSSEKAKQAMLGQAYINQIVSSVALGDLSSALDALTRVNRLCDTASGGCGCA